MFVEKLLNQGNAPLLEQMLQFSSARHKLLADNIANLSTPGYRQKDLSMPKFRAMLRERVDRRAVSPPGRVRFDDIRSELEHPERGVLFHDGQNRSAELLMSEFAKNAMMHNMAVELLRRQYSSMENALRERLT